MELPRWLTQELALFLADSNDICERLESINQKLLATLETSSTSLDETQLFEPCKSLSMDQDGLEDWANKISFRFPSPQKTA